MSVPMYGQKLLEPKIAPGILHSSFAIFQRLPLCIPWYVFGSCFLARSCWMGRAALGWCLSYLKASVFVVLVCSGFISRFCLFGSRMLLCNSSANRRILTYVWDAGLWSCAEIASIVPFVCPLIFLFANGKVLFWLRKNCRLLCTRKFTKGLNKRNSARPGMADDGSPL